MTCSRGALSALWLSSVIISKHFLWLFFLSVFQCKIKTPFFHTLTFEFKPDILWSDVWKLLFPLYHFVWCNNKHVDGTCACVTVTYIAELIKRAWLCSGSAAANLPEDTEGFWRLLSFGQRELCHHTTHNISNDLRNQVALKTFHWFHTFSDTGCPRDASLHLWYLTAQCSELQWNYFDNFSNSHGNVSAWFHKITHRATDCSPHYLCFSYLKMTSNPWDPSPSFNSINWK